ncbi:gluconokinase [Gallibacterium trehalosifermentans]|uniref:Gluconokinase n=1 Tax=Gallibacterium trehalosifermentans TaxID=516935 RepID=A0ABV6H0E9_9PAST
MSIGKSFILMGVSSTGKTSVGTEIIRQLGMKLIDGDDLHPRANIIKMRDGQPLNDEDRAPWLERIRDAAFSLEQKSEKGIIICSALKKKYRDQIREGNKDVKFIYLKGDFDLVFSRMQKRQGHYMKAEMLKSQFATLEEPQSDETDVIHIDIDAPFATVVERCVAAIKPFLE